METTTYLTAAQAAHLFPGHPSPCCVGRWMSKGKKANGATLKLKSFKGGGGWLYTTAEWIKEFIDACANAASFSRECVVRNPTNAQPCTDRAKRIAAARAELARR